MKIIVLHGPGEVAKRMYLSRLKQSFDEEGVSHLDGKQQPLSQIKMQVSSGSLFAEKRLVIVENTPDDFDLSAFQGNDPNTTVVFVGGNVSATKMLLKSAGSIKAQVVPFEGERETSVFPFLDALLEKKKEALVELDKLLDEYGEMYVLTMMYYGLRRNILPLPSSSFAQKKIIAQKQNYSTADFQKLYKKVLDAEASIKSGAMDSRRAVENLVISWEFAG